MKDSVTQFLFVTLNPAALGDRETMQNEHGRKSIFALYPRLDVRFLEWQNMPAGWEKNMLNINTPQDLEKIKKDHELNQRLFRSSPAVAGAERPRLKS